MFVNSHATVDTISLVVILIIASMTEAMMRLDNGRHLHPFVNVSLLNIFCWYLNIYIVLLLMKHAKEK